MSGQFTVAVKDGLPAGTVTDSSTALMQQLDLVGETLVLERERTEERIHVGLESDSGKLPSSFLGVERRSGDHVALDRAGKKRKSRAKY